MKISEGERGGGSLFTHAVLEEKGVGVELGQFVVKSYL